MAIRQTWLDQVLILLGFLFLTVPISLFLGANLSLALPIAFFAAGLALHNSRFLRWTCGSPQKRAPLEDLEDEQLTGSRESQEHSQTFDNETDPQKMTGETTLLIEETNTPAHQTQRKTFSKSFHDEDDRTNAAEISPLETRTEIQQLHQIIKDLKSTNQRSAQQLAGINFLWGQSSDEVHRLKAELKRRDQQIQAMKKRIDYLTDTLDRWQFQNQGSQVVPPESLFSSHHHSNVHSIRESQAQPNYPVTPPQRTYSKSHGKPWTSLDL